MIMKKLTLKKIGNILGNVVMYIFLAICIAAVILTVFSKKDADGASEIFGYQMRLVVTDSMGACDQTDVSKYEIGSIPINSMIFVEKMPTDPAEADAWYRSIKVGDVLTFRYVYTSQLTITHRVVGITEKETGGFIIELEGDNKGSDSKLLRQVIDTSEPNALNYVIGKVTGQAYLFGLFLTILKQPVGLICIIIIPCFLIILLEVIKIISVVNAEKKKRAQEETQKKDDELEELRRRLAELESSKKQTDGNDSEG